MSRASRTPDLFRVFAMSDLSDMGKTPHSQNKISELSQRVMNDKHNLQSKKPAKAPPQRAPNSAGRIPAVDAAGELQLLYSSAWAGRGYEVDFAEDEEAGWQAIQASRYDLLVRAVAKHQRDSASVI
jgi:hypothetical protein